MERRKAELENYIPKWSYAFHSEIEAQKATSRYFNAILDKIESLRGEARNKLLRVLVLRISFPDLLRVIDFPRMTFKDLSSPHRELLADAILAFRSFLKRYTFVERYYLKQRVPVDIVLDIEFCEGLEFKMQ